MYQTLLSAHQLRTARVASQVLSFHERGEPFRISHGGTNSTRRKKSNSSTVSTSDFSNVLNVDCDKCIALVEPNVSMEQLVDATLPLGFIPPVVMEFPAITVGGGFSGTSGESSSFRNGVFDKTVNRIEIILGDGQVVFASPTENSELYHGAAGGFGTFCVVTLLEVKLVRAQSFVELEYSAVSDVSQAVKAFEDFTANEKIQYLDGIMFSKDSGVVISGRLTSGNPDLRVQTYSSAWDPWFYIRAQEILTTEILSNQGTYKELVPIKEYLFRYDRGAFWAGKYCFDYFFTPFNRLTRYILDSLLHTKVMYGALHKSGLANEYIVQDIGFPSTTLPAFVEYLDESFGFYPLWLCPLRMRAPFSLSPRSKEYQQVEFGIINVGLWGPGPRDRSAFIAANRAIEARTAELDGLKCLYAHAYYTLSEFWSIYDEKRYDASRRRWHAQLLPSVFEKVTTNNAPRSDSSFKRRLKMIRPLRGLYGAWHVISQRDTSVSLMRLVLLAPLLLALICGSAFVAFLKTVTGLKQERKRAKAI
jgi:delta24-sterol reductase